MKKGIYKAIAASLVLSLSLAACGGSGSSAPASSNAASGDSAQPQAAPVTIKLGVVGENNEWWAPAIESMAKEGVQIELVKFADYTLPNQALADGEIDLNAFQHHAFLNNQVKDKGYALTAICDTIIAPLGLYSEKIKSLDELKDGDSIAIPSDATNGGRALKIIESAGLIKVDPAAGYVPEVKDVIENPKNIKFIEVEAAQTPSLLPDVAAAIINGAHAVDHGLNPQDDSIFLEQVQEGSDNPYLNVLVARTADKENPVYQQIVKAFQTEETARVIAETYKGAYLPAWN